MSCAVRVTGLNVYPVKSCAGTGLEAALLDARGIEHDREFMLVAPSGHFYTQRELPRMALIRPFITPHGLTLSAPGKQPFDLHAENDGDQLPVTIWRDTVCAVDQGEPVAEWFSDFLEAPCRLVRQAGTRKVNADYATSPEDEVSFADGYPLLLISEESLVELNARLDVPLPMNRFRPNVVVAGAKRPFAEDDWRQIRIGEVDCSVVKPCARCAITTTDQVTARRGVEPLATLATFRKVPNGVLFGQNLIHHTRATLRIGDPVVIF